LRFDSAGFIFCSFLVRVSVFAPLTLPVSAPLSAHHLPFLVRVSVICSFLCLLISLVNSFSNPIDILFLFRVWFLFCFLFIPLRLFLGHPLFLSLSNYLLSVYFFQICIYFLFLNCCFLPDLYSFYIYSMLVCCKISCSYRTLFCSVDCMGPNDICSLFSLFFLVVL
jgi:hypothetical protein